MAQTDEGDAAMSAAALVKNALAHARMRDCWMRRARERRAVPFLTDEVARCVRHARGENLAVVHTLWLLVTAAGPAQLEAPRDDYRDTQKERRIHHG